MCLPAWVTVVRGKVVSIKRNFIYLREARKYNSKPFLIGYDFLVICEDLQFQTKRVEKVQQNEIEKFGTIKYSLLKELRKYTYKPIKGPTNVFSVNSVEKGAKVLNWLWRFFEKKVKIKEQLNSPTRAKGMFKNLQELQMAKREGRIIIYGNCINIYVCVAVLLEENLPLSKLALVKCATKRHSFGFYTQDIEQAVHHMLQKYDLECYEGTLEYEFENDEITSVNINRGGDSFQLDCCALLMFDTRNINYRTFETLHHSNLSFVLPIAEGKGYPHLLINTNFQTNVKNVFAAGTITEMCTKNGPSFRFENCRYNLREVGMMIGENIDKLLSKNLYINETTLPNLKHPSVTVAKLPYGYTYILVMKPSTQFLKKNSIGNDDKSIKPLSLVLGNLKTGTGLIPEPISEANDGQDHVAENPTEATDEQNQSEDSNEQLEDESEECTKLLEESTPSERMFPNEPDYFSVTFDRSQCIQSVECFTKKDVSVESLIHLYGQQLSQFYKTISMVRNEDSSEISFCLTEDWILTLDHFTFYGEDSKNDDLTKHAYNGFWRPGYPPHLESTINNFLSSFSSYKIVSK
ncbi:cilia-and flagella-associated protein 61 [Nephila pilipes]|uniref:Cilia-and flagella-associated protein 61 n=1 Tax=Nephila pilipes TaxID=299642 RepID=A0A8X6MKG7_NEPPI|nr:cilia-and flagella-associated protein 61 [Nephila pilipes]